MADLSITVVGDKQVQAMTSDWKRSTPGNIKTGMRNAGVILERDMKKKLSGPGRPAGKKGKAAAPFSRLVQFPGVITGRLRASVRWVLVQARGVMIGARVKYDKFLVRGTKNMPSYDYVGPTWRDKGKAALSAIDKAILKPLK